MIARPDDEALWADSDDFLLGRDILVAPVVEPGVDHRRVDGRPARTGAMPRRGTSIGAATPSSFPARSTSRRSFGV